LVADPPLERQGFRTDGPRGRGALSFRPLLADVSPYARIKELPRERDRGFESRLLQRGVRCELDAAQDRMTVLGAAKVPFFNRDTLAAMLRQRRSERTCGTCDRSTPARLLLGQRTPDRLSPTARKCESAGPANARRSRDSSPSPRRVTVCRSEEFALLPSDDDFRDREPDVRIHLPPAGSLVRTRLRHLCLHYLALIEAAGSRSVVT
jgi:hypothetical protein